jgi:uncharacterized membrane-anchored protein
MTRVWDWIGRVPAAALFAVAALLQVALVSLMVFDRVQILREGAEIKLLTRPVDPRDFLRGDYVSLAYDISFVPNAAYADQQHKGTVYVKIAPKADGSYEAISLHRDRPPVTPPEMVIQGRQNGRGLQISYGLERYFVPQGEGTEIENARNQGKVSIVAAVTPSGRAAIKRLLIDGKPVYEEPLF